MQKILSIFFNSIPVLIMIGFIPVVSNDYLLTLIYIIIITISLSIKKTKTDVVVFIFGFIVMTLFEYIFISTRVETFSRNSLFGLMPMWLPFIWAYGFVAISRSIEILKQ